MLSWTSEFKTTSHAIYFGTTNPPPLAGNQTAAGYDPGILSGNTTYYWRVDEKNGNGTTQGKTWSFTTASTIATAPQNPFPEYNEFTIFPNPSTSKQITLSGLLESEPNTIYIYQIDGQLSAIFRSDKEEVHLDLSGFKDGLYLIRMNNKRYDRIRKLII